MSDRFNKADAAPEAWSALVDGEASPQEVAQACAQWRDDPQARTRWHTHQLIGDVMRSEDLASTRSGEAFLASFRERLAQEPVVLAPQALRPVPAVAAQPASRAHVALPLRKRTWAGPMAVAAGFVMVVGALLNGQILPSGDPSVSGVPLAQSSASVSTPYGNQASADMASVLVPVALSSGLTPSPHVSDMASAGGTFSQPEQAEATLIRDPQLDQLLHARRLNPPVESFAAPGGLLRQVSYAAP